MVGDAVCSRSLTQPEDQRRRTPVQAGLGIAAMKPNGSSIGKGTMNRTWILLVIVLACGGQASATSPQSGQSKSPSLPQAGRLKLTRNTIVSLLGRDVKNSDGTVIGQIANILIDQDGQPQAVVLDYGGFLGVGLRKIAVSMQVLKFFPDQTNKILLTLSVDQLRAFPEYTSDGPVTVAIPPANSSFQ